MLTNSAEKKSVWPRITVNQPAQRLLLKRVAPAMFRDLIFVLNNIFNPPEIEASLENNCYLYKAYIPH